MELSAAIAAFDRARVTERVANAEQQRKRVLAEFPLADWPTLDVDQPPAAISTWLGTELWDSAQIR